MFCMDTLQEETEKIEKELLELIISHLEKQEMEFEKAQQFAKEFLALLPAKSKPDLLEKLKTLGDTYPEAKEVYLEELSEDLQTKDQQALMQMRNAIQKGNIEHAISIAKAVHK